MRCIERLERVPGLIKAVIIVGCFLAVAALDSPAVF